MSKEHHCFKKWIASELELTDHRLKDMRSAGSIATNEAWMCEPNSLERRAFSAYADQILAMIPVYSTFRSELKRIMDLMPKA